MRFQSEKSVLKSHLHSADAILVYWKLFQLPYKLTDIPRIVDRGKKLNIPSLIYAHKQTNKQTNKQREKKTVER